MNTNTPVKQSGNPITKLYRPVYALLFCGSGIYQLLILKGRGTLSINLLAGWLILTGLLMLLPLGIRKHMAPSFLKNSQSATLALWGSLPFLSLGGLLLFQGGNPLLALTGIIAGVLLATVSQLLKNRTKPGSSK